jgi:hypothetical protein
MANKSMIVEEAVNFFGHSVEDKAFDEYLTALGIQERPEFKENPMEWVGGKEDGVLFLFEGRLGHEESFGAAKDNGSMIFNGIRIHSANNSDNFFAYSGRLPADLKFENNLDETQTKIGVASGKRLNPKKQIVCTWDEPRDYSYSLSIIFLPEEKGISFINIKPKKI